MAKVEIKFSCEELKKLQTSVIVECHGRVMGSGSRKRKFKEEFTADEQRKFKKYYKHFYKWYLSTGIPLNGFVFEETSDYALVQKFCNFFVSNG